MARVARLIWCIRRFRRDRRGVAAVEFALLAPVLALICLCTIDLGFAVTERMALDSSLRVGAAVAMKHSAASDEDTVRNALQQAAQGTFSSVAKLGNAASDDVVLATCNKTTVDNSASPTVCAERFCACPSAKGTVVSCTSTCAGATPPLAFFQLAAGKQFTSLFLPNLNNFGSNFAMSLPSLSANLKVQVQ